MAETRTLLLVDGWKTRHELSTMSDSDCIAELIRIIIGEELHGASKLKNIHFKLLKWTFKHCIG